MYEGQINDNWFVYDNDNNKITVFEKGDIDPVAYIAVDPTITEKDFHYEIMEWVLKNKGV